jgi:hypothetical protein
VDIKLWLAILALERGEKAGAIALLRGDRPVSREMRDALANFLEHGARARGNRKVMQEMVLKAAEAQWLKEHVMQRTKELGDRDKALAEAAASLNVSVDALRDRLYRPFRVRKKSGLTKKRS